MKIALGSDHAGRSLRGAVHNYLSLHGHDVDDVGTASTEPVDYPAYAERVAQEVALGRAEVGIAVCGTGIGVSMAANRIGGVRAAVCTNEFMARMARAHNHANVLCLGERVLGVDTALSVIDAFLGTEFDSAERHERRIAQLSDMEEKR